MRENRLKKSQRSSMCWNMAMPDLVSAEGNNGVIGYVYLQEMMGPEPSSIEEAMSSEYSGPRDVPLYSSDGVTIIGTFSIG